MIVWNFKNRNLFLVYFVMCFSYGDYIFKDYNSTKTVLAKIIKIRKYEAALTSNSGKEIPDYRSDWSNTTEVDKWSTTTEKLKDDNHLCKCRAYRCRCCINFSFIRRWPAVEALRLYKSALIIQMSITRMHPSTNFGCFNIQSLPGYLNLVMSFSFNNHRLAYFPIMGSNPRPFCRRVSIHHVYACLYVYDIHMYTKKDISLCLYMEVSHGLQPLITIHLDCIRQFNHHLSLIPIRRPKRKGFIDIHIAKNDTAFTILKQVFHIPRRQHNKHHHVNHFVSKTHFHKFWPVPKFIYKFFGSESYYL